jgi:hypothetical protein
MPSSVRLQLLSRRASKRRRWGGIRAQRAGESIATAEFGADEIAVCAERFAQARDLILELVFRHHDARPHPSEKLLFCDERAVSLQQGQSEVEGAPAELDRNTVGEQLPPQQHAKTVEFEGGVGSFRTSPSCVVR